MDSTLNENQLEAVNHLDGPLRILAGAGTGKTKLLVAKINKLILLKVKPFKICAITFTNKAVNEIKERILKNNLKNGVHISTYHSLCNRILRSDINKLQDKKYSNNFDIISESQKKTILKRILKDNNFDKETIKNKIVELSKYISNRKTFLNNFSKKIANESFYKHYQKNLQENNYLDYDDLLLFTYKLFLENSKVLEKWQNHFEYILVDEFQDSNDIQFEIVRFLVAKHNNLTIVGDPDQNIYSWRGANQKLILDFDKYFPNTKTVVLEKNYRSNSGILNLANDFIKNNYKNSHINSKNLQSVQFNKDNYKPELNSFFNYEQEIDYVAKKIKKLVLKREYKYEDFSILYRNSYLSREIEKQLSMNQIIYKVSGARGFYERVEIANIISLIKAILKKDDLSIEEALRLFPKIGAKTIEKLNELKNKHGFNYLIIFEHHLEELDAYSKKRLNFFYENLNSYFKNSYIDSFYNLVIDLIEKFEFRKKYKNDQEKLDNIEELLSDIQEYEKQNQNKSVENIIEKYFDYISLNYSNDDEERSNSVSIMTIHSAKGLENKVIFLVGVCENILPSYWNVHNDFLIEKLKEERRVFYVAITRAKEKLFLSYNNGYSLQLRRNLKKSRFIDEIDKNLYISNEKIHNIFNQSFIKKNFSKFKINDKVSHPFFGSGTVLSITSNELIEVEFYDENYGKRDVNVSIISKL